MMWNGGAVSLLALLVGLVFVMGLVVLIGVVVVWLARNRGSGGEPPADGVPEPGEAGSAREALDLRYARGELDREEYLQARDDLGIPPP